MINRHLLKHKLESLTDSEVTEVLEYITIMESVKEQADSPDPLEEVMLSLLVEALRQPREEPHWLFKRQKARNN